MKIRSILATRKAAVITIQPDETLHDAVAKLADNRIGALVVVGPSGELAGILSERDIIYALATTARALDMAVADCMTRNVIVGSSHDDVMAVAHAMLEKRFRHLPIVDDGHLIGIVSIGDVLKTQRDAYRGEIDTLEVQIMAEGED